MRYAAGVGDLAAILRQPVVQTAMLLRMDVYTDSDWAGEPSRHSQPSAHVVLGDMCTM